MLWLNSSSKFEFSIYNTLEQDYSNKVILVSNSMTDSISNMFINENKVLEDFSHTKTIAGTYQLFNRSANQTYQGEIYSVRIYNTALTDEEIKTNYEIDQYRFNIQ